MTSILTWNVTIAAFAQRARQQCQTKRDFAFLDCWVSRYLREELWTMSPLPIPVRPGYDRVGWQHLLFGSRSAGLAVADEDRHRHPSRRRQASIMVTVHVHTLFLLCAFRLVPANKLFLFYAGCMLEIVKIDIDSVKIILSNAQFISLPVVLEPDFDLSRR